MVYRSQFSEVLFAQVHDTHPYSRASIKWVFSVRTLRANGAASISYSCRLNRPRHGHASRTHQLISGIISALASTRSPRCQNCVVCLYLWPAASMTSDKVRGAWSGVRGAGH